MLDKLYKQKYLIFLDIEFQNFIEKGVQKPYILELGIIIFEKGKLYPILVEHVNFPLFVSDNVRLLGTEYCSVSQATENKMLEIQNKFIIKPVLDDVKSKKKLITFIPHREVKDLLREAIEKNAQSILDTNKDLIEKQAPKAMFNMYYNRIPQEYQLLFKVYMNLYENDVDVKKRVKDPKKYLDNLIKYFSDGLVVHKETTDLQAFDNDTRYYKTDLRITNNFDIAVFNRILVSKVLTPSLNKTYMYLYDEKIKTNDEILKFHDHILEIVKRRIGKYKAHNPLVDAFMTIFVFLLMLNK